MRTSTSHPTAPRGTPRSAVAHRGTLPDTTARTIAAKNPTSGLRTRACVQSKGTRVPKVIPTDVKARILALLRSDVKGPEIVKIIAAEFAGMTVSPASISLLRKSSGMPRLVGGRRQGEQYSPHRTEARRLRALGWTLEAIGQKLGIKRQAVHNLVSDDN